jgi:Ca-activated chloride channel family protein
VTVSRLALAGLIVAGGAVLSAQKEAATTLVEVDAVVTDDAGKPVTGLTQGDFEVKDDGKRVDVKTFDAIAETSQRLVPRSIVLLLDDSGVGSGNTLAIQQIARTFVARMAAPDEFSVVRLNSKRDEAFGDRLEALLRISEYRSDALPFFGRETMENALRVFAKVSRTLEPIEHRRKALVCVGVADVCGIQEPVGRTSLVWKFWLDAAGAMGRANTSLYSLEPNGASRRMSIANTTIAEATGGEVFLNTSDVTRPIEIVRRDTGNFYLLGYWTGASDKPLHTVEVKVKKRGLHVRARRVRGDAS